MYFNRFDICEAYALAAHDWGQYGVIDRLHDLGFRLSPMIIDRGDLSENGRDIYDALDARIAAAFEANPQRLDVYAPRFAS